ncbi:kynurenine formamidase isoform X2 [Protopterus annectens]|uniref:kynurenine formamidase isoform X2 n=1 Tax=Protopterus annectens TaxID=7888 RepID=UPI001CFAC2ED|nr:kynurenine formamidase isoform X2 [Protopterus annectens]
MGSWRDMDIEELEKQYSPSCWSHRMEKDVVIDAHVKTLTEGTQKARSVTQTLLNVAYGGRDGEKLDIYLPADMTTTFPVLIYIHGGYWQFLSKEESGFLAPPLVSKGVAVVAVDYDTAPKGDIDIMVDQVRRSVIFIIQQYSQISGIYLCGHSAGAHLVAMTLSTDWTKYEVTPDIKGAFLVSGIYDLLPIVKTYINGPLKMTDEDALRNSPIQHVDKVRHWSEKCEIIIVVGEHDPPEFHRQSEEYFEGLKNAGLCIHYEDVPDTDHFNVIEQLTEGDYLLTQMILKMILRT